MARPGEALGGVDPWPHTGPQHTTAPAGHEPAGGGSSEPGRADIAEQIANVVAFGI